MWRKQRSKKESDSDTWSTKGVFCFRHLVYRVRLFFIVCHGALFKEPNPHAGNRPSDLIGLRPEWNAPTASFQELQPAGFNGDAISCLICRWDASFRGGKIP